MHLHIGLQRQRKLCLHDRLLHPQSCRVNGRGRAQRMLATQRQQHEVAGLKLQLPPRQLKAALPRQHMVKNRFLP